MIDNIVVFLNTAQDPLTELIRQDADYTTPKVRDHSGYGVAA